MSQVDEIHSPQNYLQNPTNYESNQTNIIKNSPKNNLYTSGLLKLENTLNSFELKYLASVALLHKFQVILLSKTNRNKTASPLKEKNYNNAISQISNNERINDFSDLLENTIKQNLNTKTTNDRTIQVESYKDLINKNHQKDLAEKERILHMKEKELEIKSVWIEQGLEKLKYHEKEIDQKELNLFEFSVKYQNENNYEQFIQKIKSSIFPDVKANNFWENIAERSNVIDCVNELREYENNLKFYHEKQKTYKEIIQSELETLQVMKNSLKVREEKCSILDVQLEKLGLEKLHNERVLVDILNANKEMSEKINRLDNQMSNPQKNVNSAILELNWGNWTDLVEEFDEKNPLQIAISELKKFQSLDSIEKEITIKTLDMIINIGSQIIIRDQEFSKSYQSKVLFLESKIADLSSLEKVNAEKSKLANTENRLEKLNKEVFDSSWYHKTLELIKDALIEKQYYQYSSRLAEKEIEEHELKSQLLEIERSKLNEILENLNSEKDKLNKKVNNVTEIITVIINSQYISQNNLAYLRDELAGLLNEPNKKIGINEESLLIAKSISKWISFSKASNMTKTLQVSKLMFAEWKLECVIKRIGLSSNQIKNQKNYWMELLWIKNRSSYSKISCNDLENSKSSFIKMLVLKLDNLYDMINNSYKRNLRKHFTRYQSNIQRIRTNEIKILADKLFNLAYAITNKHVVRNINQKLSQRAFKLLNPHFKISSSKYDVCRRKYLLKWRLNIEKNKSNYLEALIPNIYKTLYDQIQKEYALRQTLKEKQKLINSNLKDTKKLIYKLVS